MTMAWASACDLAAHAAAATASTLALPERLSPSPDRVLFVMGTVLIVESVFWFLNAMLAVCYKCNLLTRYRIQPGTFPRWGLIQECLLDVLVSHFAVRPLLLLVAFPLVVKCGVGFGATLPSVWTAVWHVLVSMQVDDCLFYWSHRLLHHPWLYKHIHKKHHAFRVPIGLAVEYSHPVEVRIGGPLVPVQVVNRVKLCVAARQLLSFDPNQLPCRIC
eukprot:m.154030 g.154030  ORF g.154030 m.154030 type:complete len:217 (-) comp17488_c0_seq3:416-1066(-)